MKEVIVKKPEDVIDVSEVGDYSTYWFVSEDKIERMFLVREVNPSNGNSNYIFRSIDSNRYGHSGYSETVPETIKRAIEVVPGTKVFQFDSLMEVARFLLDK